mmetsp:Transcript_12576/g.31694  ORF Transcript_12576/g.31694 Transcript_12576/m.31694 type:complete len:223 (+) Transcript_12576:388-1056(+)
MLMDVVGEPVRENEQQVPRLNLDCVSVTIRSGIKTRVPLNAPLKGRWQATQLVGTIPMVLLLFGPGDDAHALLTFAQQHKSGVAEVCSTDHVGIQDKSRDGRSSIRLDIALCKDQRSLSSDVNRLVTQLVACQCIAGELHELHGICSGICTILCELRHGADTISDAESTVGKEVRILAATAWLLQSARARPHLERPTALRLQHAGWRHDTSEPQAQIFIVEA